MATINSLPSEILCMIASLMEAGVIHMNSRAPSERSVILSTRRALWSLALVNRRFYDVFNPALWRFTRKHNMDMPVALWAVKRNRIDVLEKAVQYQLPLVSPSRYSDPIYCAAQEGQDAMVCWLLDNGVSVDGSHIIEDPRKEKCNLEKDEVLGEKSPLHTALRSRRESTAITLISRGAKCRFQHSSFRIFYNGGYTALHMAAAEGLNTVIEYLAKATHMNLTDSRGETPLQYAVTTADNEKTVRTLLRLGADINANQGEGGSPLNIAIYRECFENAIVLLDAGARVDLPEGLLLRGIQWSGLRYCRGGRLERLYTDVVRRFIANGADVNDASNTTPLQMAIKTSTTSVVFELLKAGADTEKTSRKIRRTPFDLIWKKLAEPKKKSMKELHGKASLLAAAGARLDKPSPYDGKTQLQKAITLYKRGPHMLDGILRSAPRHTLNHEYLNKLLKDTLQLRRLGPAETLVHHGATCDAKPEAFAWALSIAERDGIGTYQGRAFSFCMDFLPHSDMENLFKAALKAGNEKVCHMLIDRGVLSSPKESKPWLHLAARNGSSELVRRLVRAGMDVDALDDEFRTPMMVALDSGKPEVADQLFELGADPFHPRPDAECRRTITMSTQVLSPFEFAIRHNHVSRMTRWWLNRPAESRPTDFYIPRVLTKGPTHCENLRSLRMGTINELAIVQDEDGLYDHGPKPHEDADKTRRLNQVIEWMASKDMGLEIDVNAETDTSDSPGGSESESESETDESEDNL